LSPALPLRRTLSTVVAEIGMSVFISYLHLSAFKLPGMFENISSFKKLEQERRADLSEPLDLYKAVVAELERSNRHDFKSRASFIRDQCAGFDGKAIFQKYRGKWGIPVFNEDLLNLADFKRGFLYRFRDHGISRKDSLEAKAWFLHSEEARMTRRYEIWSQERGFDECVQVIEGTYKELLTALLGNGDHAVLESPAFSEAELDAFIASYKAKEDDAGITELMTTHISKNPNYRK
jgi:hypothetical protein